MIANQYNSMPFLHAMAPLFVLFFFCIFFGLLALVILPYWKIYSKAGFPGWLSLLMVVPLVSIVVLYIVAFSEWRPRSGPWAPYPYPMPPNMGPYGMPMQGVPQPGGPPTYTSAPNMPPPNTPR